MRKNKNFTTLNKEKLQTKWNTTKILLSFASGMLFALSMPGFNLWPIAWIGFIPFILIICSSESLKPAIFYSLAFGLGFNLLSLNWLLGLHSLEWLGFSNQSSFFMTRFIWLYISTAASYYMVILGFFAFFILKSKMRIIFKSILIALCWSIITNKLMTISGEYSFPWAMIEYSQYYNLPILQFAQYIGGIGIGFFIILVNTLIGLILYKILREEFAPKPAYIKIAAVVAGVVMVHLAGLLILNFNSKPDRIISATVIQSNLSIETEKKDPNSLDTAKKVIFNQVKEATGSLVVVPETAFFDLIRYRDKTLYNNLIKLAESQNKTLVIGTVDLDFDNQGTLAPTNSAIIFDSWEIKDNIYNKQCLVPFGEYTPFKQLIPDVIKKLTYTAANTDYVKGNKIKVIRTSHGNIAPSICYEIIFPNIIKKQVLNGASVLVNLSNLSWFHDSIIKDQFVAFSVMRAAESRKPMIVSANTGYSAIVDFTGKIIKKLPKNSPGTFTVNLGYDDDKTLFSKSIF